MNPAIAPPPSRPESIVRAVERYLPQVERSSVRYSEYDERVHFVFHVIDGKIINVTFTRREIEYADERELARYIINMVRREIAAGKKSRDFDAAAREVIYVTGELQVALEGADLLLAATSTGIVPDLWARQLKEQYLKAGILGGVGGAPEKKLDSPFQGLDFSAPVEPTPMPHKTRDIDL